MNIVKPCVCGEFVDELWAYTLTYFENIQGEGLMKVELDFCSLECLMDYLGSEEV